MKPLLTSTLLALVLRGGLLGGLAACGEDGPSEPPVQTPAHLLRVLPATSCAVDVVLELLPRERIVAIPRAAFAWSSLAGRRSEWADLPVMGSFNGEEVLTLDPDLILVSPWSEGGPIEAARAAGIGVVVVSDARTWEDLVGAIRLVGSAVGEEPRAAELVRELELRRDALARGGRRGVRVLAYSNFGSGGYTSGSGTTLDLAIELAGMVNAAAEAGLDGNAEVDLEQVLEIDPDVFLTSTGRDGVAPGARFLRGEPILAGLAAVREERILVLPADLFSSASHHVLDAAEEIARQVERVLPKDR